jgi:hypothetical protein
MFEFIIDIILRYSFKKKFKNLKNQSKQSIKTFKSIVIIVPQEFTVFNKVFTDLSEELNISTNKITVVVYNKKKNLKISSDFKNQIFCSKKQLGISGNFPVEMIALFEKKFDLLVNYFNEKDIFPELISINCKSKLRVGFFKASHKINDVILDITPDETDLFLDESKNYLNTFLK